MTGWMRVNMRASDVDRTTLINLEEVSGFGLNVRKRTKYAPEYLDVWISTKGDGENHYGFGGPMARTVFDFLNQRAEDSTATLGGV